MTYSEYRKQFKSVEEFRCAFGKLSEEVAHALIAAEKAPVTVKAVAFTTWQMAKKEAAGNHEADD